MPLTPKEGEEMTLTIIGIFLVGIIVAWLLGKARGKKIVLDRLELAAHHWEHVEGYRTCVGRRSEYAPGTPLGDAYDRLMEKASA